MERIIAGKPRVVVASRAAWRSSPGEQLACRPRRTCARLAPSSQAPRAMPSSTSSRALDSSGARKSPPLSWWNSVVWRRRDRITAYSPSGTLGEASLPKSKDPQFHHSIPYRTYSRIRRKPMSSNPLRRPAASRRVLLTSMATGSRVRQEAPVAMGSPLRTSSVHSQTLPPMP